MPLPLIKKPHVTTSFSQGNSARQDKACQLIHAGAEPADKEMRRCLCNGVADHSSTARSQQDIDADQHDHSSDLEPWLDTP